MAWHRPDEKRPVRPRIIRLVSPAGEISVLLPRIPDREKQRAADLIALYFRRWQVEKYYKAEKSTLQVECFHARSVNGVMQEMYAVPIVRLVARILIALAAGPSPAPQDEPQFKHAVAAFAQEAALLAPEDPVQAAADMGQLPELIRLVSYRRPPTPRPPQPGVKQAASR